MKKLIAMCCTIMAVTFSGCTLKAFVPKEELPPDKPYNRTIMETDNGYYYAGEPNLLSLRYTERSNGADIFLCAKPECTHNGEDTCTATYQFLVTSNYVLYDGAIYFVANTMDEESLITSLYKASLDGSALDKVGDLKKVKYSAKDIYSWGSLPDFVIHKGYAYIYYCVGGFNNYNDFIGDGFAKMNIKTGEAETIFYADKYAESRSVNVYAGCGDYVYYNATGVNSRSDKTGNFRYNINTGESQKLSNKMYEIPASEKYCELSGITEKKLYMLHGNNAKHEFRITGYDAETFEPDGFDIDISDERLEYARVMYYGDKIFVAGNDKIDVYSDKGELIGSHECQPYLGEGVKAYQVYDERQFDISDNKLYIGYSDDLPKHLDGKAHYGESDFSWYYCPIENIVAGTGDWTKAYTVKNPSDYWKEDPVPKFVKELIMPKYNN